MADAKSRPGCPSPMPWGAHGQLLSRHHPEVTNTFLIFHYYKVFIFSNYKKIVNKGGDEFTVFRSKNFGEMMSVKMTRPGEMMSADF